MDFEFSLPKLTSEIQEIVSHLSFCKKPTEVITLWVLFDNLESISSAIFSFSGFPRHWFWCQTIVSAVITNWFSLIFDLNGSAFDFTIINLASGGGPEVGIVTNTDVSLTGNMVIAANSSGSFRAVRTGTTTVNIYRI